MAYEHKTTEAVNPPHTRAFTVKPSASDDPLEADWEFGADYGRIRSYDFDRGDRRFVQQKHDIGVATAMVVYVNRKVREDGRDRVVLKSELTDQVVWTVLEP